MAWRTKCPSPCSRAPREKPRERERERANYHLSRWVDTPAPFETFIFVRVQFRTGFARPVGDGRDVLARRTLREGRHLAAAPDAAGPARSPRARVSFFFTNHPRPKNDARAGGKRASRVSLFLERKVEPLAREKDPRPMRAGRPSPRQAKRKSPCRHPRNPPPGSQASSEVDSALAVCQKGAPSFCFGGGSHIFGFPRL